MDDLQHTGRSMHLQTCWYSLLGVVVQSPNLLRPEGRLEYLEERGGNNSVDCAMSVQVGDHMHSNIRGALAGLGSAAGCKTAAKLELALAKYLWFLSAFLLQYFGFFYKAKKIKS